MDFGAAAVRNRQKFSLSITSALVSAILEWLLIFMLFMDACFSYMVTGFARHYHLQIPCLLCSRLDHVFGNEKSNFCWDLICGEHKLKISSLIFCQLHNKLADAHEICESCFFSFATMDKSKAAETYSLLVGKFRAESYDGLVELNGASSGEDELGHCRVGKCFCCSQQWVLRTCPQKLFKTKSIDSEYNRDDVQGITEGSSYTQDTNTEAHVKHRKISSISDAESEVPFSDNEGTSAIIREVEIPDQDSAVKHVIPERRVISLSGDQDSEKLIDPTPMTLSLLDLGNNNNSLCTGELKPPLTHELELNSQQADQINDFRLASIQINGTSRDGLKETIVVSTTELGKEVTTAFGEESKPDADSKFPAELWKDINLDCAEMSKVGSDSALNSEIQVVPKHSEIVNNLQTVVSLDLGDAYKLAIGARGRQLSGRLLQHQRSNTDSTRVSEDLKLLLSQLSAQGFELSLNDISPRMSTSIEDYKTMDTSGAMQILQRRISLQRNESNLSFDGSAISEIEGESMVDRLKRQVEHDKKIIGALYKELEEERNASAVAANQAMAMITRLQEEKAALHMEALQCLRMMEEQAEYDGEALHKASDILVEKEKQIQDLGAEIQLLRDRLGDVNNVGLRESVVGELKLAHEVEGNHHGNSNQNAFHNSEDDKYSFEKIDETDEVLVNVIGGDFAVKKRVNANASSKLEWGRVSQEYGETSKNHVSREALVNNETILEDISGFGNSECENMIYD